MQVQPVRYAEELKPDESASISRAETPAASANRLTIADCRMQIDFESAIRIQKSQIEGPVAQRNQSATLRRSRSHVQIVPGPPNQKSYGVAELERRESLKLVYVGSNPTSVAI